MDKNSKIYCGQKTYLEGPALEQFNRIMALPGVILGAGFPDLHPGRGVPVGAAFLTKKIIYPALIGNDIGCGMTLFSTNIKEHKFKRDKFLRRLGKDISQTIQVATTNLLDTMSLTVEDPYHMIGTIGAGNHFVEILAVDKVVDNEKCEALNIKKHDVLLLVHSGSRCYGEMLWREIASKYGDKGLEFDSPDGIDYLTKHAKLIEWATFNRFLIGNTIGNFISGKINQILSATHNSITPIGEDCFIHRKGASNVENNLPIVVAGSRGASSFIVDPVNNNLENIYSIAHGAGRKWNRQNTKAKIKAKTNDISQLYKTKAGSIVVCPNKDLLYEEAPEGYKDINLVIKDLQDFKLAQEIAELRPIVNIKP
jgi:release factor H-coupled RctB family protein